MTSSCYRRHLKCPFLDENQYVLIPIYLTFAPACFSNNQLVMIQEMARRRTGIKALPKPMSANIPEAIMSDGNEDWIHWRIYASCTRTQRVKYSKLFLMLTIHSIDTSIHGIPRLVIMPTLSSMMDGTVGCRNDNFRCHQRRQSWHNDNSQFSVLCSVAIFTWRHWSLMRSI